MMIGAHYPRSLVNQMKIVNRDSITMLEVIVDGGMVGSNPGKGGWGAALRVKFMDITLPTIYYGETFGDEIVTNNIAEYRAILGILKVIQKDYMVDVDYVSIYSDSLLAINQIRGKWICQDPILKDLKGQILEIHDNIVSADNGCIWSIQFKHRGREYTKEAHNYIAQLLGRKK